MDSVLKLRLAFKDSGFEVRSIRYLQNRDIMITLLDPLHKPELMRILKNIGVSKITQSGVSTYIVVA